MRNQKVNCVFILVTLLVQLVTSIIAFAQSPYQPNIDSEIGTPKFTVETKVLLTEVDSLYKVIFFIALPFQNLQYQLSKDGYVMKFIFSCELIRDGKNQKKVPKIVKHWQDSVFFSFQDHQDLRNRMLRKAYPIILPQGYYKAKLRIRDRITDKYVDNTLNVTINPVPIGELFVSELLIVKPNNSANPPFLLLSGENRFYPSDTVNVYYEIKPEGSGTIKVYESLNNDSGKVVFDTTFLIEPTNKLEFFRTLPLKSIRPGLYQFSIQVEQSGKRISKFIGFRLIDVNLPIQVSDISLAIKQMKYILEEERIQEILKLPIEKQIQEFKNFWSEKDPIGETSKNERMEEYFRRVEVANQRFTTKLTPGWESDRGKVYIIYGEPTDIEVHHYVSQGRPYEVWYYSHLQLRFTFEDQDGFGEFKLVSPIWD